MNFAHPNKIETEFFFCCFFMGRKFAKKIKKNRRQQKYIIYIKITYLSVIQLIIKQFYKNLNNINNNN